MLAPGVVTVPTLTVPTVRTVARFMAITMPLAITFFVVAIVMMATVTATGFMARTMTRVTMTLVLVTIIVMRTLAVIQQRTQRESRDQWSDNIVIVVSVIVTSFG